LKTTFISLGVSTDAIGIRILSAVLKQHGHSTQLIFLPTVEDIRRRTTRKAYTYSPEAIGRLVELARGSQLIGLSVMTHHQTIAKELTQTLKSALAAPVIWGGIHPTVQPEECLQTADMVCQGEGETAMVELAGRIDRGEDFAGLPGIWIKRDGRPLPPPGPGPMAQDLDALPFPDYSFEDHHLLVGERIERMTPGNWHQHLLQFFPPFNSANAGKPAYQVLSARGCPFSCSFCGEAPLTDHVYGKRYFRRRSVGNLLQELAWVKATFPFIGEICFCDDTFPSRGVEELRDFCRQYKVQINMPFYVLTSPVNVTQEKFDLLVEAGLTNVGMGIQTGSSQIVALYEREKVGTVEQSLKAARILNGYKGRLLPFYDFIIENPYETREDLLETLKLMIQLPRPYETRVYALSFFPGTPLYEKASADGILYAGLYDKTFGQRTRIGYLDLIIDLNKWHPPRGLLEVLISKPFLFLFNRPWADAVCLALRRAVKWVALKLHIHEIGLS
jgi:anaerobic magnesium-protoporphyrin IX monomethyl ester cyclase